MQNVFIITIHLMGNDMRVAEFYRLELHWDSVEKNKDNSCSLRGAYFSGPVLSHADKINSGDNIVLDLTPQYARVLTSYYFTKLVWGTVEYKYGNVLLQDAVLTGDFINTISNLDNTDFILIDTSKHDGDSHIYNLVYRGLVVNKDGKEYENG